MNRRQFKKLGWALGAVMFALALQPGTAFAAKGIVKLHEGDWTGNLVFGKLAEIIIEDELDYKVKMVFMPAGPAVSEAIISGDIDAGFETWPSYSTTKEKYVTEYGGDGSVEMYTRAGVVGQSGWYVPRYVVEGDSSRGIEATAPGLKTYADLNAIGSIFTTPETAPKGRLVACPVAAWQCMDSERAKQLGVDYVTVELGSETAHWAELEGAYARGEPILIYAWEPHWVHAKYDLVEVGLPEYSDDGWPATDWPEDLTYNYGSPTLKDRAPEVHAFLSKMQLTNAQQAPIILAVDVEQEKLDTAVRAWMAENESVWKAWLP